MKTKKMSLASIQGKLSRAEMKNIMAGSGCSVSGSVCTKNSECCSSSCSKGMNTGDKSYCDGTL